MFYFEVIEMFFRAGVRYLITGGLAVNLHGIPRVTNDIDIIISMEPENIIKVINSLTSLGYKPLLPVIPENLTKPYIVREWIEKKNMVAFSFYDEKDNYKVLDIIISHNIDFDSAFQRKTTLKVKEVEIFLTSIDDIILMKSFSDREQDRSDIEMLRKIKIIEEE